MVFKTLDNKQGRSGISEGWGTNEGSLQLPQLMAERVSRLQHRERGPTWSLGALPELRRWSWEFGEAKVTRFHRAEHQRGESCTERKLQRSTEQSTKYRKAHSYEETTQGWKKNHPKGLEGTILRGHTELKIVLVPTSQMEKLITHRAMVEYTGRFCLSSRE